jgi:hypothetical protein
MDRRRFLQGMAASSAAFRGLSAANFALPAAPLRGTVAAGQAQVEGHTLLCTFVRNGEDWKVYEDLRTRDGPITFISAKGIARVMPKTAEATSAGEGPFYLGMS